MNRADYEVHRVTSKQLAIEGIGARHVVEFQAAQDGDLPLVDLPRPLDVGEIAIKFGREQTIVRIHGEWRVVGDG